jgi:F-type H+-transporting ATPase subunit b
MPAWAAAAAEAGAEHGAEPFYLSAEFWVFVAFVVFVLLVGRTAFHVVTIALDDRAQRIKDQVDEATRLAEEAQQLLATYERKQRDAAAEAEAVVELARREADRLSDQAAQDLERSLKRREQLAFERIAQAEAGAIAEVRAKATEIALEATRRLLAERVSGERADALIDAAIDELPKRLN